MKPFAEIIRVARSDKKLILRQVVALTDIDQSIINKFELGEREPSKKTSNKISKLLSIR